MTEDEKNEPVEPGQPNTITEAITLTLKEMREIQNDPRMQEPMAHVDVNAPLALIQMGLKGKLEVLRKTMTRLRHLESLLREHEPHSRLLHIELSKDFRTLWVEALESGEYNQAEKALRDFTHEKCFCCLGVAAEVGLERKVWIDEVLYVFEDADQHDAHAATLEAHGSQVIGGFEQDDIVVNSYEGTHIPDTLGIWQETADILAYMNDGDWTFEDIAGFIKSPWFDRLNVQPRYWPDDLKGKDTEYIVRFLEEERIGGWA